MTRLRWLTGLAFAGALGLALPAGAATSTLRFADPAGDWAVPAQDIVQVSLQSVVQGSRHWIEADVMLAAPVGPAFTQFVVSFRVGQTCYTLSTSTVGGAPQEHSAGGASVSPSGLSAISCAAGLGQPDSATATAMVDAGTVKIRAPYALGLRGGERVTQVSAAVGSEPIQAHVGVGSRQEAPVTGDLAATSRTLTLR